MAHFEIIHEAAEPRGDWMLCFQWGIYHYDDNAPTEHGYRFMWRDPAGNQKPYLGQTRIPSADLLFRLIQHATEAGWFITCEQEAAAATP